MPEETGEHPFGWKQGRVLDLKLSLQSKNTVFTKIACLLVLIPSADGEVGLTNHPQPPFTIPLNVIIMSGVITVSELYEFSDKRQMKMIDPWHLDLLVSYFSSLNLSEDIYVCV